VDTKINENPLDDHDFLHNEITISMAVKSLMFLSATKPKVFFHGLTRDCKYEFKEGCCPDDINRLEEYIGYTLAEDYKQFLQYTNGMEFSPFVASPLFDVESVYQARAIFDQYPTNFLVIGSCCDGAFNIMIKLDGNSDACMYFHEIGSEYLGHINCNFTTFFNRFVMTHGSPFWEWGTKSTQIEAIVS